MKNTPIKETQASETTLLLMVLVDFLGWNAGERIGAFWTKIKRLGVALIVLALMTAIWVGTAHAANYISRTTTLRDALGRIIESTQSTYQTLDAVIDASDKLFSSVITRYDYVGTVQRAIYQETTNYDTSSATPRIKSKYVTDYSYHPGTLLNSYTVQTTYTPDASMNLTPYTTRRLYYNAAGVRTSETLTDHRRNTVSTWTYDPLLGFKKFIGYVFEDASGVSTSNYQYSASRVLQRVVTVFVDRLLPAKRSGSTQDYDVNGWLTRDTSWTEDPVSNSKSETVLNYIYPSGLPIGTRVLATKFITISNLATGRLLETKTYEYDSLGTVLRGIWKTYRYTTADSGDGIVNYYVEVRDVVSGKLQSTEIYRGGKTNPVEIHHYDAATGRKARVEYFGASLFETMSYEYDALGRQTSITVRNAAGALKRQDTFNPTNLITDGLYTPYQWAVRKIGLGPDVWNYYKGEGVTIAVIDSGVYYNHQDLFSADGDMSTWLNEGEIPLNGIDDDNNGYVDDRAGWDFWANDGNPIDENGHGTAMAGIIAAQLDADGMVGVAPLAKIMALRAFSATGSTRINDFARAIRYAVDMGAKIINMSLGAVVSAIDAATLQTAINYAHKLGAIIVAAAGNNNGDVGQVSPAALDNVITVGGTMFDDRRYQAGTSGSNYGSQLDFMAPGDTVAATHPEGWANMSGTSPAAAMVSGAIALLLNKYPGASPEFIIEVLKAGAVDLGAPGWDPYFGWGRINVASSLNAPAPTIPPAPAGAPAAAPAAMSPEMEMLESQHDAIQSQAIQMQIPGPTALVPLQKTTTKTATK